MDYYIENNINDNNIIITQSYIKSLYTKLLLYMLYNGDVELIKPNNQYSKKKMRRMRAIKAGRPKRNKKIKIKMIYE